MKSRMVGFGSQNAYASVPTNNTDMNTNETMAGTYHNTININNSYGNEIKV